MAASNPNLPPLEPHPEPPEILPPSPDQDVPLVNQIATPRGKETLELAEQRETNGELFQLDSLVTDLEQHARQRANFDNANYKDTFTKDLHRKKLDDDWQKLSQSFGKLMTNGDTQALLERLGAYRDTAKRDVDSRHEAKRNLDETARDTRHARFGARNDARKRSLDLSADVVPPLPNNPTQAEVKEHDRRLKARAKGEEELSAAWYESAFNGTAATKAAMNRDNFHEDMEAVKGYYPALDRLYRGLAFQHEVRCDYVGTMITDTTRNMRSWELGQGEAYTGQMDALRANLDQIGIALSTPNFLSRRDSARAELLTEYNRLRYRLESRGIHLRDPSLPGPEFTADGGIRVNEGSPAETVLYANGDSMRTSDIDLKIDPDGNPIRRSPNGMPVAAENIPVVDLATPYTGPQRASTDRLVARWEESRHPDDAREAHAALINDVRRLQGQDDQLTARADTIQTRLAEIPDALHANQIAQASIGTPGSPREAKELARLQKEAHQLRTEETNLKAEAPVVVSDRRRVRERLNPAQYSRSLIEAGARLPEQPRASAARRLGRRMLGRTVDTPVETPPEVQADGSIVRNMVLNGSNGEWRLHPDGRSTRIVERIDPRTGSPIHNPRTNSNYWQENREPNGSLYRPARFW